MGVNYIVYGKEICPETGRPHLQGYVEFKSAKTKSACIKSFCNNNVSVRVRLGTPLQASVYCKKEDADFYEFGKISAQGTRTDLNKLKDDIWTGKCSVDDIVYDEPYAYHMYGRTLNKIEDLKMRKKYRTWMTVGEWLYGKTGVGKSHLAFEGYSDVTHYVKPNDNGWWDGYCGQEIVIINDFRGDITYGELLDLCDKWPKTVKRRNREPMPFLAKKIIITSSLKPEEVYHNLAENDNLEQLYRRFTVREILKNCTEVVEGNTDLDLCAEKSDVDLEKITDEIVGLVLRGAGRGQSPMLYQPRRGAPEGGKNLKN